MTNLKTIINGDSAKLSNYNLQEISRLTNTELSNLGLRKQNIEKLQAVFSIAKDINNFFDYSTKIGRSEDAFKVFRNKCTDMNYEGFYIILLTRANKVIRVLQISEGGVAGTVADPKKVFKLALEFKASHIIIGHNHPSGNNQPSGPDTTLTNKIVNAGKLLDLPCLDHIIFTDTQYYSYADEGQMN